MTGIPALLLLLTLVAAASTAIAPSMGSVAFALAAATFFAAWRQHARSNQPERDRSRTR